MHKILFFVVILLSFLVACGDSSKKTVSEAEEGPGYDVTADTLRYEQEAHLKNIRQYTFGGDNAEAYFSYDDQNLTLQITDPANGIACDQIFLIDLMQKASPDQRNPMISNGKGRTTCSFFMPGDSTFLYASTFRGGEQCPPPPERSEGHYVWPVFESFDIYVARLDGTIIDTLTDVDGYDAEATVSPKGDKIVFTSMRSGDLELYTMDMDGGNVQQVTDELGYDGGAFFSPDGTKLIFRASRPAEGEEADLYKGLLARGLVQPTNMELFICNVDGSDLKQITQLGNANWAPYFHPSGEKIIFSSNHKSERGFPFNLFMINVDGSGLDQVTFDQTFDSFPMFSYDGTKLVFSSNRFNGGDRSTNVFVAEWAE